MYDKKIDAQSAIQLIRKVRPKIEYVFCEFNTSSTPDLTTILFTSPNTNFQQQLDVFHESQYKISRREKATRLFYMDKTVGTVMSEF